MVRCSLFQTNTFFTTSSFRFWFNSSCWYQLSTQESGAVIVLLNVFATVFFLGTRTLAVFRNLPFFLNEEVKLLRLLSNDRLNDGAPKDSSLDLADVRTWRTDVFAFDARVRPRSSEYSYQNMNSNVFDRTAPINLFKNRKST